MSSNSLCYKLLENMQTNLTLLTAENSTTVRFVDRVGYVFDRMVLLKEQICTLNLNVTASLKLEKMMHS